MNTKMVMYACKYEEKYLYLNIVEDIKKYKVIHQCF